jgi:hypothetical protein
MRTALFILTGLLLMAACFAAARFLVSANAARVAMIIFIVVWLAVAAGNMWMGVSRAGYSVSEEFPIFLVIFAIPVIAAFLVKWKLL